jgi:uncharacterized protein (DUF488 family)
VLGGSAAAAALDELAGLLDGRVVALLCYERDPAVCHRSLVTDALADRLPGLPIEHR